MSRLWRRTNGKWKIEQCSELNQKPQNLKPKIQNKEYKIWKDLICSLDSFNGTPPFAKCESLSTLRWGCLAQTRKKKKTSWKPCKPGKSSTASLELLKLLFTDDNQQSPSHGFKWFMWKNVFFAMHDHDQQSIKIRRAKSLECYTFWIFCSDDYLNLLHLSSMSGIWAS